MGACLSNKEEQPVKKVFVSNEAVKKDKDKDKDKQTKEKVNNINNNTNIIHYYHKKNNNSQPLNINSFPELEDEFKDFELYKEEIYVGEGVKRDRAYKTELKIDVLNEKRSKLWSKLTKKNSPYVEVFKAIKTASIVDNSKYFFLARAEEILLKNNLYIFQDNSLKYLYDDNGNCYRIPNWSFNDPYVERDFLKIEDCKLESELTIIISEAYNMKDYQFKVKNTSTIGEIKNVFMEYLQLDLSQYKIRAIYSGFEVKDNQTLFELNVQNEARIMLVKNKII